MGLDRTTLENGLGRLSNVRAMVIGDLILDEYVWGGVDRVSPEAPVQIVTVNDKELRLGGAGNVVNNLLALNCQVDVASVVGNDDDGRVLLSLLKERGLSAKGVFSESGRVTSRKTRILASNQQIVRIDQETTTSISAESETFIISQLQDKIDVLNVIYVSDYQKGVLTGRLLESIIESGRRAGVPVLVDPKGHDFSKYRGATLLTPNRKEAQDATGIEIADEDSLVLAGRKLLRDVELDAVVLTRSEEGMTIFTAEDEVNLPTVAREVFDVSGAGDTVLALFGLGMALDLPLQDAAGLANLGAGVVVGKVGTSTVTARELLEACGMQQPDSISKLVNASILKSLLAGERQRGRKIVFTNGCFDLLHVGHVKYLQSARQLGDLLVLGLNSDNSIRRLKGESRPLINQDERAHILAALDCIDYVVIFDEDTPELLIEELKPDILVKGGDYTPDGVVGRDIVESYGGRVEIIQFVDGKSTTNIINKILESYQR